jgi:lysophospholipase L1-like esterase
VAALDKNQGLLWVSATQTYGVDQKMCPPLATCKSDRTDNWRDTIPTQVLSRAAYIAIKHRYTPKGITIDDIGNWLRGLGNDLTRELGPILQALGLVASPPPPQQTLACGQSTPGHSANHPFTVVTLGDSIMWGQGLPDGQKFRDRVTAWLQGQFGGSRQVIQIATRSHSGAILAVGPSDADRESGLGGEIPNSYPTISKQVELTLKELQQAYHVSPSDVDLLLIDGGINNVDVLEILKPNHSTGTIKAFTNAAMDKMEALLQDAMRCFPSGGIVVTGYFPIVSSATDLGALTALFGEFGAELGAGGGLVGTVVGAAGGAGLAALSKDQMVRNSAAFADTAHTRLLAMVSQLNPAPPAPARVALAWPNFQNDNAYGAPNSFLWTVTDFVGPELDGVAGINPPQAGTPNRVAWNRARDCTNVGQGANPKCLDASMGHPNIAGAQAYADAIINQLRNPLKARLGLPTPPALEARACPTIDGLKCSALPKVPRGQETTTPLRAIVSVTSHGRPVAGASVGVDGGTGGVTGAAGHVVVTYNLFLYSPRQEQGPGGPDTDPRGKPIHALGNANTGTLRVPGATASKAGFQAADVSLPRPLVR